MVTATGSGAMATGEGAGASRGDEQAPSKAAVNVRASRTLDRIISPERRTT
jgi:hypothetical protein